MNIIFQKTLPSQATVQLVKLSPNNSPGSLFKLELVRKGKPSLLIWQKQVPPIIPEDYPVGGLAIYNATEFKEWVCVVRNQRMDSVIDTFSIKNGIIASIYTVAFGDETSTATMKNGKFKEVNGDLTFTYERIDKYGNYENSTWQFVLQSGKPDWIRKS